MSIAEVETIKNPAWLTLLTVLLALSIVVATPLAANELWSAGNFLELIVYILPALGISGLLVYHAFVVEYRLHDDYFEQSGIRTKRIYYKNINRIVIQPGYLRLESRNARMLIPKEIGEEAKKKVLSRLLKITSPEIIGSHDEFKRLTS